MTEDPRRRRTYLRPERSAGRGAGGRTSAGRRPAVGRSSAGRRPVVGPDSRPVRGAAPTRAQERGGRFSGRGRVSALSGAGAPAIPATPTRGTGATEHIKRLSQTGLNRASGSERRDRKPTTGGGPEGIGPKEVDWRLRSPFPSPADGVRGFPPRVGSRKPKRAERAREPEGDRREWGGGSEGMGSPRASEASECRPCLVLVASCGGNVGAAGEPTSERSERVISTPACVGWLSWWCWLHLVVGMLEPQGSPRASEASECRPRVRAHVPRTRARRIPFYIGALGGFIVYYLV